MATPKKKRVKRIPRTKKATAKGSYQAWLKSKRGKGYDKRTKKKVEAATKQHMTYQDWLQSPEGKAFNKKMTRKVRSATKVLAKKAKKKRK